MAKRVKVAAMLVAAVSGMASGCTPAEDGSTRQWVDAVCAGLTATFGAVPTPEELNRLGGGSQAREELLLGLDRAAEAASGARRTLDGYGAPAGSDGSQLHRRMITLFDQVAQQLRDEGPRVRQAAETADGVTLGLLAVDALPAPTAEWGELMRADGLSALAEASPTCQRTQVELKGQL